MQDIWLEKYRPKTLSDVKGNKEIIEQFKTIVEDGVIPNMILSGPPGCGKTTSVLCIARQILGEHFSKGILELNASDERGIDVVRTKIKDFSQLKVKLPNDSHKIVILDESDSLTAAAQQALRMIISDFSDTTRFVFACNDSSRLIEPIQSRCVMLRFSKLKDEDVLERLQEIVQREKVVCDLGGYEALIFAAEGDMRTAINNLQATWVGAGQVTQAKVFEICDIPDIQTLNNIVRCCVARDREGAFVSMKDLWDQSFTPYELVNTIGKVIENHKIENVDLLYDYIDQVCALKTRVLQGVSSFIQLQGFIAKLCDIADHYHQLKK